MPADVSMSVPVPAMPLPRFEPAAPRVLIADDDPIFRSLARSRLERIAGDIVEAEDGTSAWSHIRAGEFQLVIVDLDMPGFDGFGLIQVLRGHPVTRHIPIVVCTAHSTLEAMRKAVSAGASSYLTKPVNWSMFEPHVEQLLHATMAAVAAEQSAMRLAERLTCLEETLRAVKAETDTLVSGFAAAEEAVKTATSREQVETALAGLRHAAILLGLRVDAACTNAPSVAADPTHVAAA